jgi:hypothetical protein
MKASEKPRDRKKNKAKLSEEGEHLIISRRNISFTPTKFKHVDYAMEYNVDVCSIDRYFCTGLSV